MKTQADKLVEKIAKLIHREAARFERIQVGHVERPLWAELPELGKNCYRHVAGKVIESLAGMADAYEKGK